LHVTPTFLALLKKTGRINLGEIIITNFGIRFNNRVKFRQSMLLLAIEQVNEMSKLFPTLKKMAVPSVDLHYGVFATFLQTQKILCSLRESKSARNWIRRVTGRGRDG